MGITKQNSPTAKWTALAPTGNTPDGSVFAFIAARNTVPFFVEDWIVSVAPGDMDLEWLDASGCTLITFQIVNVGAFSGSFQGSINGGKTFADILPEVGTNPITTAGFFRMRGAYEYVRFKATAVTTSVTVSLSAVTGA